MSDPDLAKIQVIDLFAGPGGLGEGFASYEATDRVGFELSLSIEKDEQAHKTLLFRSFFRRLQRERPEVARHSLQTGMHPESLLTAFPGMAASAHAEALRLELSEATAAEVRDRVDGAISPDSHWVLIGGPPCQAYSLIGRVRNRGVEGYVPEADKKQTLYVEYLQILADHAPPVFVMENVKGLLSAQLHGRSVFERIREDLSDPSVSLEREGRGKARQRPRYRIVSLTQRSSFLPDPEPREFVIKSENFGIPQARHRVILLGVREDIRNTPEILLESEAITVKARIGQLPRLRSGMTQGTDSVDAWRNALRQIPSRGWMGQVDAEIRDEITSVLQSVGESPAARGGDFIAAESSECGPVYNHSARAHISSDLDRYLFAACFAKVRKESPPLSAFPRELLPAHRNAENANRDTPFGDRFRVQLADRYSSTITSHIAKDGHYYIHYDPSQCRSLTVREAARLQTFPDDYLFRGPRTSQYQQVGNAVPPDLARQIAHIVAGILR